MHGQPPFPGSCRSRVPGGTQSWGQPRDTDDGDADHGGTHEADNQQKWSGGEMRGRRIHEAHHDSGGGAADESGYLPPLRTRIDNLQQFNRVFIGFPT